ncbi:YceH family protein [Dokdonella soli]|uniref:YceH family protein n=1 Tax=Dokdonella soli TaxID=529810 RepID=A0ABN1IYV5_9GAMM
MRLAQIDESSVEDATPPNASESIELQPLDAIEARILGCLIEKAAITPEVYPLTVNAIVAACNQKTSREPLMQLETGAVAHALRAMEGKGLVRVAPASQRAMRYEHRFDAIYGVTARQRAVLCVMLLRGPQTLGELLTRTDRLAEFPGLDDVRDTLDRLIGREPSLVVRLARGPGQREDRYMHLLCGPVAADAFVASAAAPPIAARADLQERVERLEAEADALRAELAELRERMGALTR